MEPHGLLSDMCFPVQQPGQQNLQRVPLPPSNGSMYPSEHQTLMAESGSQLVNEENDPKDSFVWQHESTLLLISLYRVNQHLFLKGSVKKKSVWSLIAKKMKDIGQHIVSPAQCENKWKSLTAAYRKVADHNTKHGHDRKTCPYFNEISGLYGYQPKPTNSHQESTLVLSGQAQYTSNHSESSSQNAKKKKNFLNRKKQQNNTIPLADLVRTLKDYSDQRRKESDAHLMQLRQMHNEKMAVLNGILEVLKSLRK